MTRASAFVTCEGLPILKYNSDGLYFLHGVGSPYVGHNTSYRDTEQGRRNKCDEAQRSYVRRLSAHTCNDAPISRSSRDVPYQLHNGTVCPREDVCEHGGFSLSHQALDRRQVNDLIASGRARSDRLLPDSELYLINITMQVTVCLPYPRRSHQEQPYQQHRLPQLGPPLQNLKHQERQHTVPAR